MSIERKCENCELNTERFNDYGGNEDICFCCNKRHSYFIPKEELVREDERNKILNLLKEDLRDYKTLREEYKDNKNLAIEDTAIIAYINDLINTINI